MCIRTVDGIFSFNIYRSDNIISFANCGSYSNFSSVVGEWRIFANKAEEKSHEKICISVLLDFSKSFRIQFIISFSTITCIVSSFTLIFYKIAIQNLYVTLPSSWSLSIVITLSQILIPFWIKYSTPWGVDAITEINAHIACLSPCDLMFKRSRTKLLLFCLLIKNMSFLINSATRDHHYSGEI